MSPRIAEAAPPVSGEEATTSEDLRVSNAEPRPSIALDLGLLACPEHRAQHTWAVSEQVDSLAVLILELERLRPPPAEFG